MKSQSIFDPQVSYSSIDNANVIVYIDLIRQGVSYKQFISFANQGPFTIYEWSTYLHLSERTIQRYQKEEKKFDAIQSEKIIEIVLLYKKGVEVFGNTDKFNSWLETDNLALGRARPKTFLDSSFGINMLKDELNKIEYGILA